MVDIASIESLLDFLDEDEKSELDKLLTQGRALWEPLPGPQREAFHSPADIVGYGGAAGGGKTDLACGLALTQHRRIGIFRENGTELTAIVDRLTEILRGRDGYNGQDKIWRVRTADGVARQIEFGSYPNPGDWTKYQGRPHDLLVFDEAANHPERAVRFLLGWLRSTDPAQKRCRVLMTFNPPTTAEGRWVVDFFAPWLDDQHPNPAAPGELRYFATIKEADFEVPDGRPFVLVDGERVYDFNPGAYAKTEIITPMSRTFIPSRVTDNPFLAGTSYIATLQAMPEPLRSQMLNGDFRAGMEDDPWQVIPTDWVDAAMARWKPRDKKGPMDSVGVDVARGGRDNTIIARRHEGLWFDELMVHPGKETPEGDITAGLVIAARRDQAPVHIDVVGWGSEAYAHLKNNNAQVIPINAGTKSHGRSKDSDLPFSDLNTELHWRMREALDPANDTGIALPNDNRLRADLCARKWRLQGGKIAIESKEEVKKRIGRSPDFGDACILANIDTVRAKDHPRNTQNAPAQRRREYDPYSDRARQGAQAKGRRAYNPYE